MQVRFACNNLYLTQTMQFLLSTLTMIRVWILRLWSKEEIKYSWTRVHLLVKTREAAVVSILLHWCTTWKLTKCIEKKLDGTHTRMLRAILNKSWRQHPTKLLLFSQLLPITITIKVRRTRHAGYCWRNEEELISDILLWTPSHGREKAGWPARTYV